jgi:hypothetical protein
VLLLGLCVVREEGGELAIDSREDPVEGRPALLPAFLGERLEVFVDRLWIRSTTLVGDQPPGLAQGEPRRLADAADELAGEAGLLVLSLLGSAGRLGPGSAGGQQDQDGRQGPSRRHTARLPNGHALSSRPRYGRLLPTSEYCTT